MAVGVTDRLSGVGAAAVIRPALCAAGAEATSTRTPSSVSTRSVPGWFSARVFLNTTTNLIQCLFFKLFSLCGVGRASCFSDTPNPKYNRLLICSLHEMDGHKKNILYSKM